MVPQSKAAWHGGGAEGAVLPGFVGCHQLTLDLPVAPAYTKKHFEQTTSMTQRYLNNIMWVTFRMWVSSHWIWVLGARGKWIINTEQWILTWPGSRLFPLCRVSLMQRREKFLQLSKAMLCLTSDFLLDKCWALKWKNVCCGYPGEYAQTNISQRSPPLGHSWLAQPMWLEVAHTSCMTTHCYSLSISRTHTQHVQRNVCTYGWCICQEIPVCSADRWSAPCIFRSNRQSPFLPRTSRQRHQKRRRRRKRRCWCSTQRAWEMLSLKRGGPLDTMRPSPLQVRPASHSTPIMTIDQSPLKILKQSFYWNWKATSHLTYVDTVNCHLHLCNISIFKQPCSMH